MTSQDSITVEVRGHIAVITINRPATRNALLPEHYSLLIEHLKSIDKRDDILVTVLTSTGRYFSTGTQLSAFFTDNPNEAKDTERKITSPFHTNLDITHAIIHHSKVLIAALNGPVLGLPAALISHADFIYAAPHTYLHVPFTSIGVAFEGGASRSLVKRLGVTIANEALLMGRRIPCEELVRAGFVNGVISAPSGREDDSTGFREKVMEVVEQRFGEFDPQRTGMLIVKELARRRERELLDRQNMDEMYAGMELFNQGVPQDQLLWLERDSKGYKL